MVFSLNLVIYFLFLAVIVFLIKYFVVAKPNKLRREWKLIAEGELKRVVSRKFTTNIKATNISKVFLENGWTVLVADIYHFPPAGTHIKIYKNSLGEFKIETADLP